MPTYKETLEWSYKMYPTLYINELDVLNNLFFTIGTGKEWVDGELCDQLYPSFEEQYKDVLEQRKINYKNNIVHKESLDKSVLDVLNKLSSDNPVFQKVLDNFKKTSWEENDESNVPEAQRKEREKRISYATKISEGIKQGSSYYLDDNNELIQTIYPIHEEYSAIMNLPDNIKPDWLEAAKKAIQYAIEGKWILTESDKTCILKAQQRINVFWPHTNT
jgi:vacuolar-type H+-ATPase subunit I/STV1